MSGVLPETAFVFVLPFGLVLLLVGSALITPLALVPLSQLTERLLRPFLGMESTLAVRQLRRHPTRTSLVVGVLMISVMLSTGYGNAILNSVEDARAWMLRIFKHMDFMVIPTALSSTELLPAAMPEEYASLIAEIEGVRRVDKGTILATSAEGHQVTVFTLTCAEGEASGLRFVGGVEEEIQKGLCRGEVVIGTAFAQRAGLAAGETNLH